MFVLLAAAAAVILTIMAVSLIRHVHRFSVFQQLSERNKMISWIAAAALTALLGLLCLVNISTMLVVVIHLVIAFLLSDLIAWIIRKACNRSVQMNSGSW